MFIQLTLNKILIPVKQNDVLLISDIINIVYWTYIVL